MHSRAKLFGHAIHPMLIPFPLGLWPTAIVFDVIGIGTGNPFWGTLAFWMIAAGIIGALIAAVFGAIDLLAIPSGTRAKRIGLLHGSGNVVAVVFFAISWWLRRDMPGSPGAIPLALEFAGLGLGAVTGWLGGELVERLGVGVDPAADLNAPSSLTSRPAPIAGPHSLDERRSRASALSPDEDPARPEVARLRRRI